MKRDIIVIGGGVTGRSVALRAALAGASVGLVDAGVGIPPATTAAAGMLAPSFERPQSALMQKLFELHRASLAAWRDFDSLLRDYDRAGVDLRLDGIIGLAQSEDEHQQQEMQYNAARGVGLECELLDGNALSQLEPAIGDSRFGAIFSRDEGQVDPLRLADVLATACERIGVSVEVNTTVKLVEQAEKIWRIYLPDGRKFEAQCIVLATGARSIEIAAMPPITPVKGEALSITSRAIDHVVRTQDTYLCPKSDGRIVVGATERPGESDTTPDMAAVNALRSRAERIVPEFCGAREVMRWAGIRPGTPDGAPILGPAPDSPSLVYALGGYRNGILQAPLVSRLLVDAIISNRKAEALDTFSIRRFQKA